MEGKAVLSTINRSAQLQGRPTAAMALQAGWGVASGAQLGVPCQHSDAYLCQVLSTASPHALLHCWAAAVAEVACI